MEALSNEEQEYLTALSWELYKEVVDAIKTNQKNIVIFLKKHVSNEAVAHFKDNGISIQLIPYSYRFHSAHMTLWRQAIVME